MTSNGNYTKKGDSTNHNAHCFVCRIQAAVAAVAIGSGVVEAVDYDGWPGGRLVAAAAADQQLAVAAAVVAPCVIKLSDCLNAGVDILRD